MAVAAVRTPAEYESRLRQYVLERSEESRAVRVGEKETSEQAEIVARYADLFSREQLEALREAEAHAPEAERERLYRLLKTCEGGIVAAELAAQSDELENALLAATVPFQGEELPLRTAQAKLAVLRRLRATREELGNLQADVSGLVQRAAARAHARRRGARGGRFRRCPRPFAETRRRRASRCASWRTCSPARAAAVDESVGRAARALVRPAARAGARRRARRRSTRAYVRRLSPLESTYTKERAVEICLDTLARPRLRPREGADQARPRGPAAEVAAGVRDRVGPAEDRPPDHARAGRPARLPGVPARGRATRSTTRAATRRCRTRSASSRATTR